MPIQENVERHVAGLRLVRDSRLRATDSVLSVDGGPVRNAAGWRRVFARKAPGEFVEVGLRDGRSVRIEMPVPRWDRSVWIVTLAAMLPAALLVALSRRWPRALALLPVLAIAVLPHVSSWPHESVAPELGHAVYWLVYAATALLTWWAVPSGRRWVIMLACASLALGLAFGLSQTVYPLYEQPPWAALAFVWMVEDVRALFLFRLLYKQANG